MAYLRLHQLLRQAAAGVALHSSHSSCWWAGNVDVFSPASKAPSPAKASTLRHVLSIVHAFLRIGHSHIHQVLWLQCRCFVTTHNQPIWYIRTVAGRHACICNLDRMRVYSTQQRQLIANQQQHNKALHTDTLQLRSSCLLATLPGAGELNRCAVALAWMLAQSAKSEIIQMNETY